ncbi:MAG TPA: ABC transporter ATP-binding protein [bacterium]|nr:ABC transporter ATP-binding protein [bacterium]
MTALSVSGLGKTYGHVAALNDVSFEVAPGELFCISGPDAAGKSTLLRILAGTLKPDSGSVTILGSDGVSRPPILRYSIGYMPQRFAIYADLTAEENLAFYCAFYGLGRARTDMRVEYLLGLTRLARFRKFRAGNLSGGMKQKLVLACALVHEPDMMLLDEPTTGIDPLSRREFWGILTDYLARGKTIIYSTVYLEEALRSNRIALMDSGTVKVCDTPENLLARVRNRRFTVATDAHEQAAAALSACPLVASVQPLGSGAAFLIMDTHEALEAAIAALAAAGVTAKPEPAQPTLEDVLILAAGHDRNPPGISGRVPKRPQ